MGGGGAARVFPQHTPIQLPAPNARSLGRRPRAESRALTAPRRPSGANGVNSINQTHSAQSQNWGEHHRVHVDPPPPPFVLMKYYAVSQHTKGGGGGGDILSARKEMHLKRWRLGRQCIPGQSARAARPRPVPAGACPTIPPDPRTHQGSSPFCNVAGNNAHSPRSPATDQKHCFRSAVG